MFEGKYVRKENLLECQSFEKRKLASYFRDCIPGRNQAPGQIEAADAFVKRINLTAKHNTSSETRTRTSFSDFTRRVGRNHALPIETDFAELFHTGELVSDFIEIHSLDLDCAVGRTEGDKLLPLGSMEILYVL